jgi:hypothetical protein
MQPMAFAAFVEREKNPTNPGADPILASTVPAGNSKRSTVPRDEAARCICTLHVKSK